MTLNLFHRLLSEGIENEARSIPSWLSAQHSNLSCRWDAYLDMPQDEAGVSLFSAAKASVLCFCLTGLLALVLFRTLRRDLAAFKEQYASKDNEKGYIDTLAEQSNWSSLAYDVFRPPKAAKMLAVVVRS